MAAEWFCDISGKQIGPLSAQQLKAMAEEGRLAPEHKVRQGANGPWVPAARVKGLFSADAVPSASRPVKPVDASATPPPPVAQPVSPAESNHVPQAKASSIPPPPPASTAAATPPATGLPKRDEFSIVTAADTPWERAAGRSGGGSSGGKKSVLIVGLLVVMAVGLGIAGTVFYLGRESEEKPSAAEAKPPAHAPPKKPVESVEIEWIDASQAAIQRGDMQVRIVAAVRGVPRIATGFRGQIPAEELLLLTVQLQNLGSTRKLEYSTWRSSWVRLSDNVQNTYRPLSFGPAGIEGQIHSASIYPGETVEDLLIFERPVASAEYLQLELPASAFDQTGTMYFKIPREMVVVAEAEPEPRQPEIFDGVMGRPAGDAATEQGFEQFTQEPGPREADIPAEEPGDDPNKFFGDSDAMPDTEGLGGDDGGRVVDPFADPPDTDQNGTDPFDFPPKTNP